MCVCVYVCVCVCVGVCVCVDRGTGSYRFGVGKMLHMAWTHASTGVGFRYIWGGGGGIGGPTCMKP